jgi:hypothetical protein
LWPPRCARTNLEATWWKTNRHDDFNSKNLDLAGSVGKFHPLKLRFNQNLDFSQMGITAAKLWANKKGLGQRKFGSNHPKTAGIAEIQNFLGKQCVYNNKLGLQQ